MDVSELFPEGYHLIDIDKSCNIKGKAKLRFTWSQKYLEYYIIGFGVSRQYENVDTALDYPILSDNKSPSESQAEGRFTY